jgi:hypothetical protein
VRAGQPLHEGAAAQEERRSKAIDAFHRVDAGFEAERVRHREVGGFILARQPLVGEDLQSEHGERQFTRRRFALSARVHDDVIGRRRRPAHHGDAGGRGLQPIGGGDLLNLKGACRVKRQKPLDRERRHGGVIVHEHPLQAAPKARAVWQGQMGRNLRKRLMRPQDHIAIGRDPLGAPASAGFLQIASRLRERVAVPACEIGVGEIVRRQRGEVDTLGPCGVLRRQFLRQGAEGRVEAALREGARERGGVAELQRGIMIGKVEIRLQQHAPS